MNANVDGMNKPSPTASVNTPSANDSDQDFDPSAEMLINDFDDEHTLEEEEANDDCSNITNEIMDLKKEGEMPIEQLLALYGYEQSGSKADKPTEPESLNQAENDVDGASKSNSNSEETAAYASQETQVNTSSATAVPTTNTRSSRHIEELSSQWTLPASATPLPNTNLLIDRDESDMEDDDDEDDDDDENDDDDEEEEGDWRRTIQVGSDYQAVIPDGLNGYGNVPPYENEDKLLWDASVLPEDVVVNFLRQISQIDVIENSETLSTPGGTNGSGDNPASATSSVQPLKETTNLPNNSNIRDDEMALYLLHQCGHNVEEALRRKKIQQNSPFETMSSWSEEECINFEDGIRLYGKDFHQIQKNKVPTRSVGELVQFYYLWKKTERHDMYASKWRVEKKKYSLHPGTTDYMDRFIDEQENLALQAHSMSTTNYTRQQSHGSYSIIHYNYTSSSGSVSGQQPSNVPTRENVSDNISDPSTSQSNGAGPITGKSSNSVSSNITLSNGPETVNRNAVSTTSNDSLTSGVSRENVQINSSNTNPSKTTSTSDLFSPLTKMRMNIVDR